MPDILNKQHKDFIPLQPAQPAHHAATEQLVIHATPYTTRHPPNIYQQTRTHHNCKDVTRHVRYYDMSNKQEGQ